MSFTPSIKEKSSGCIQSGKEANVTTNITSGMIWFGKTVSSMTTFPRLISFCESARRQSHNALQVGAAVRQAVIDRVTWELSLLRDFPATLIDPRLKEESDFIESVKNRYMDSLDSLAQINKNKKLKEEIVQTIAGCPERQKRAEVSKLNSEQRLQSIAEKRKQIALIAKATSAANSQIEKYNTVIMQDRQTCEQIHVRCRALRLCIEITQESIYVDKLTFKLANFTKQIFMRIEILMLVKNQFDQHLQQYSANGSVYENMRAIDSLRFDIEQYKGLSPALISNLKRLREKVEERKAKVVGLVDKLRSCIVYNYSQLFMTNRNKTELCSRLSEERSITAEADLLVKSSLHFMFYDLNSSLKVAMNTTDDLMKAKSISFTTACPDNNKIINLRQQIAQQRSLAKSLETKVRSYYAKMSQEFFVPIYLPNR